MKFTMRLFGIFVLAVAILSGSVARALEDNEFDTYGGYKAINSVKNPSFQGKTTELTSQKLTDSAANFPENGLVGKCVELLPAAPAPQPALKIGPNGLLEAPKQTQRFHIVKNTKTEISTDPADGDMTAAAKVGDGYRTIGFFTTEKIGNRWLFITPEGHAFVVLGVSVIARDPLDGLDKDGKSYRSFAKLKYSKEGDTGSEWVERWARGTCSRLRSWGFNTIGTFSYEVQATRMMPYYATLRITNFAVIGKVGPCGNVSEGTVAGGAFPDIYNPELVPFMETLVKDFADKSRDDPWVIGLFVDQMDELRGFDGGHANLGYMALASGKEITNGKKEKVKNYFKLQMVKFLQGRYPKIEDLNAAWGASFASFDDIAATGGTLGITKDGDLKDHPKVREDLDAFEEKVAEDYTRMTMAAIRKYDPNHVVFAPNFSSKYKLSIVRGMAKGGGFDCYFTQWPAETYDIVKRPMLGAPNAGFLSADADSPLRLQGKIDKVEMTDLPPNPQVVKIYDYGFDVWWNQRGNATPMFFPDVPKVRDTQTDPWAFQMIGSGKDPDGKTWFAVRSSGGYRAGSPQELCDAIQKMLADGKTPHYKRFSFGDCKDQKDRGEKWAKQIESLSMEKSSGGDYFRVGHNWWKYSDNGWTYWLERYNFGLVTLKDNAYDGKEATKLGADGKAGTWDDESADYGDCLSTMAKANKGVYKLMLDAK